MNILIADNHSVVLEGLKHILKKLPDIEHEEEVTNGIDANKMIENNVYDFVILDISLLGMSGLDILKILKIKNNITHILILSMHPEEQYAVQALKLWVKGYVTKNRAGEELLAAIKKISCGGKYVSPELAEYMASNFDYNFEKALHQKLGEREFQIMILHAKGKTSREIATDLFISEKTVGTHRLRIMQKMGMKKKRSYFLCY